MKKRLKFILLIGISMLFLLYSLNGWRSTLGEKEALKEASVMVGELEVIYLEEQNWLLQATNKVNNDEISELSAALQLLSNEIFSTLNRHVGHGDAIELTELKNALEAYGMIIEDYKSYHAVMKNSVALIEDIFFDRFRQKASADYIDETLLLQMQRLLFDFYEHKLGLHPLLFDLESDIHDRSRVVKRHMMLVMEYNGKIKALDDQLRELKIVMLFERLKVSLQNEIREIDDELLTISIVIFISALLFLGVGIVSFIQEVKSRERVDRLSVHLEEVNVRLLAESYANQKLAQEFSQFANALDESAIVSKTDPQGFITYVNSKFCEVSGYEPSELIGRPHNVIRHPDMPAEIFKELWETIKSKKIFRATIKNRKKNGTAYYVDSVVIPIIDIEGEVTEYLAVRYDVTELVRTRDEALAAQLAKDRFLANMSHELRTPLNSILGFVQIMLKRSEEPTTLKYLEMVYKSSGKLLALINDILDLSKIQSGRFTITPRPFELESGIRHLARELQVQADQKQIDFIEEYKQMEGVKVSGDWMRISQIVTNLLSNAIKFTPERGRVMLKASYRHGRFTCAVSDSGIGMKKEVQENIFHPFTQADDSTTREFGGTGLGLSISSELAKMMEGELSVESEEGEGSTFTLSLPLPLVT